MEFDETTAVLEPEAQSDERYLIDIDWYDQHNLSFNDVAQARMCPQCQARLGEEAEEKYPVADKKTRRVTYEIRRVKYGSRPLAIIRDCCSRRSGFINPDMPVLEAVFRIMLANANQPMPLEHVRDQLREWCPTGRCQWLLVPMDMLRRVVERDHHYGLQRYEVPEVD
jgi:hypothetical protein